MIGMGTCENTADPAPPQLNRSGYSAHITGQANIHQHEIWLPFHTFLDCNFARIDNAEYLIASVGQSFFN
jgi:hypothetical protein